MRKLTLLTGSLLVLALALTSGLATPRAAWAFCYCDPNEAYTNTGNSWGKGADCTAAHNALVASLAAITSADCGGPTRVCGSPITIVTPCHLVDGGMYQEDGNMDYKCKVCG
jgi:hypothetical protein